MNIEIDLSKGCEQSWASKGCLVWPLEGVGGGTFPHLLEGRHRAHAKRYSLLVPEFLFSCVRGVSFAHEQVFRTEVLPIIKKNALKS